MRWIFIPLLAILAGCSRAPTPHEKEQIDRALDAFGFHNGRDYNFPIPAFICDKNDAYRFTFTAENRDGKTVTGQACAGLFFKGWTIRID